MSKQFHATKRGASLVLIIVVVVLLIFLFSILYVFFNPESGRLGILKDTSDSVIGERLDELDDEVNRGTGTSDQTVAPTDVREWYTSFISQIQESAGADDCFLLIPSYQGDQFGISGSDTTYTTVFFDPLIQETGTLTSLTRGYGGMDFERESLSVEFGLLEEQNELDQFRERIYNADEQPTVYYDNSLLYFMDPYTLQMETDTETESYDVVTVQNAYVLYVKDAVYYFIRNCNRVFDGCSGGNSHYRNLVQGGENVVLQEC